MTLVPSDADDAERRWREVLSGTSQELHRIRSIMRRLPSAPRCKLCLAPYHGVAGVVLRPWFGPWERNPQLCKSCFRHLGERGPGGAEVELSMLFADIRGSTGLGERLRPAAFGALLQRFYGIATEAIVAEGGLVDKFVGDEVIGLFIPGWAGDDHAGAAIRAARTLLARAGSPDATPSGPIPVGAGVHAGVAYVGTIGSSEEISDFTALGDAMNATARLASLAAAGELLVSVDAAGAGPLPQGGERRSVEVRGRTAPLDVVAIRVTDR